MTNAQKAAEIRKCFSCHACKVFAKDEYALNTPCDTFCEIMQAMEWKEQQLIGKCKEFCNRQTTGEYYDRRGVFLIDKYVDDMLNFIKGE